MVDIEASSVATLEHKLAYIGRLKTYFNKRDTQPILDGYINVYKDDSKKKEALIKAVPVQIKGDTKQSIKKNTIYYPVDIADLKGFMTTDGAIYFVIGIDKENREEKIYYACLLPIKITGLLKNIPDTQQTKNIQLKAFPKTDVEILDIFLNFIRDSNKQSNVKEVGIMSLKDLQSKKEVHHIEFGYTSAQKNLDISDLLGQEFCIYAVNNVGISYPFDEGVLTQIKKDIPQNISCGGKIYYNKVTVLQTADDFKVLLGKGLTIHYIRPQKNQYNQIKIEFNSQGTVNERLNDINFFIALIEKQDIYLDDSLLVNIPNNFEINADLDMLKKHKNYLELLAKTMDLAGIPDDHISFDQLNEDNEKLANYLIRAFINKELSYLSPYPEEDISFGLLQIAGIKILVVVKKTPNKTFEIENFFSANLGAIVSDLDHKEYPSSRYILLKKEHFLYACNIKYDDLYTDVTKVDMNPFHFHRVTHLILEILKAYDTNKNIKLLDLSEKLATWLIDNETENNKNIAIINLLQIKQRKGTITEHDKKNVLNILTSSTDDQCKAACFILLNMPENAQKIINSMDENQKKTFQDYPIYYLLEKHS